MAMQLHISFNGNPGPATAAMAVNKFNKPRLVCQQWDDGVKEGFDNARGIWLNNDHTYTDGCGNSRYYTGEVGINTGTGNPGDYGYNPNYLQVADLREIINAGGDVANHSTNHSDDAASGGVSIIDAQITRVAAYQMGTVIVPTNFSGYAAASYPLGYTGISSEGDYFDQFNPARHHKLIADSPIADYDAFIRDFTDEWDDTAAVDYLKGQFGLLFNGQRDFSIIGTHSPLDSPAKLAGFKNLYDYLKSIAGDTVLVASLREYLDYRHMRALPMSQQLAGNVLTVTFDTTGLNGRTRWRDVSLNITGGTAIAGVTTNGFDSAAFNPATGLVNGFSQKTVWATAPANTISVKHGRFVTQ